MATHTWNVDPSHSSVHFSVRHLMIAKVRGTFGTFSGALNIDDANFNATTIEGSIDAASIDTQEAKRDGHLKSADFFDAEKFPKLTFKSTRIEGKGESFKVTGDLTLHGVTKQVVLDAERNGAGKDPWGNDRVGFSAKGHLNRKDFGLNWNQALEAGGVVVSEKVDIELEISAVKAK